MPATADTSVAVDFLKRYRPGGFWAATSIDPAGGPTRTQSFKEDDDALVTWLDNEVGQKRNIYFHVNRTIRMIDKKAERTDIASVDWLHVDVDPDPGEDLRSEQKRILAILQKHDGLPTPTLIVYSGGGYQAFWRLKDPIEINGDMAKAVDAARYNVQIQQLFGADACHNVDRIMRLPGTINFPNKKKRKRGQKPVRAEVISWSDATYDISEFTKAPLVQDATGFGDAAGAPEVNISGNVPRLDDVEQLSDAVSQRCKVVIVNGWDEEEPLSKGDQSRSAWLFYVVCELVRAEVKDDVIYAVITDPDFKISASVLDKGTPAAIEKYAIKQIRSAKEFTVEPMLKEINDDYSLVEDVGGKSRVVKESYNPAMRRSDISYLMVDGFKQVWNNRFVTVMEPKGPKAVLTPVEKGAGAWWMTHPNRRTYSRVIFAPNEIHDGCLNLWRGFACEARPGNCDLYLEHLRRVICREHVENYNYLIRWMAFAVQFPGEIPEVAIVLRGEQGTGKGTAVKYHGELFGCHFKHITNPKHVTGQFNGTLEDAVVVFADECFIPGSKEHESNQKTLISEKTINLEKKGIDVSEGRNCTHLWMATNEGWAAPVEHDDRRYFILDVSNEERCDTGYFGAIAEQMDNGGREALLHYLLNLDLSKFNVRKRPETEELQRQKLRSLSPAHAWWLQKLEDGKLTPRDGKWLGWAVSDVLLDGFAEACPGSTRHSASIRLANFLKEVCPPGWPVKRQVGHRVTIVDSNGREHMRDRPMAREFPPLTECRAFWDEKYGNHVWDDILPPLGVDPDEPF